MHEHHRRLFRGSPLLLACFVMACSGEAAGPCRLQPVTDLPVSLERGGVEVAGRVNGLSVQLLVDTGSEGTVLTTETVAALQLPRSKLSVSQLKGVAGAVTNADVFAELTLGKVDIRRRLVVATISGIGGLVGGDLLSEYDVEFDLPSRRVRLWKAPGCGAEDLPWTGPRATVPVTVTGGGRILVPVMVNGTPVVALLDSGASVSLLQTDAARRLGVTAAILALDPLTLVRGVDGGVIKVRVHGFDSLAVGGQRVAGARIGVGDSQLQAPDMMLGLDYLRSRRVWVSYRASRIFVQ